MLRFIRVTSRPFAVKKQTLGQARRKDCAGAGCVYGFRHSRIMLGLKTNPWSRREFLSVGSLGMGGLALPDLLRAEEAVKKAGGLVKDKCVVFLFQHGGPSQYETFDPKMSAPSGIRSMTGEIPTTIPGITFGSTMQRLAKLHAGDVRAE